MLNQMVIVGRLAKEVEEVKEGEERYCIITLNIPRSFKNIEGIYESDELKFKAYYTVGSNAKEYCNKGDILGIKGRIQNSNGEVELIAEKITFLTSKKED